MKKFLLTLIVLAVIAGAVIFGVKTLVPTKEIAMADILPQDVAFYYSIQNLETIWKDVRTSNFWREFSGLKLWQDIQIAGGLLDIKNQFKENIGIELTEENFLKLAGKELTVAIIPTLEQTAPPALPTYRIPRLTTAPPALPTYRVPRLTTAPPSLPRTRIPRYTTAPPTLGRFRTVSPGLEVATTAPPVEKKKRRFPWSR